MNFALKLMNLLLKMMNFAFKMTAVYIDSFNQVSVQWKNPDLLFKKSPGFLLKNLHFLLKNG